jgi:hypothetical protein
MLCFSQNTDNIPYNHGFEENCTTIMVGRLASEDGMFLIEELQKIALQRCKTAREAVVLIGQLAEEYGYAAMNRWEEIKVALWGMFGRGF